MCVPVSVRPCVCASEFVRTITYTVMHGLKQFGAVVALEEEKCHL